MKNKILIADDDLLLVTLLEHKLRQSGFDVHTVNDGRAALEAYNDFEPDLVVLDGMMPGLDGFQVLRELKQMVSAAQVPILMLTARRQESDIMEGLSLGATDYLVKPFSPDELVARISRLIDSGTNVRGRVAV